VLRKGEIFREEEREKAACKHGRAASTEGVEKKKRAPEKREEGRFLNTEGRKMRQRTRGATGAVGKTSGG